MSFSQEDLQSYSQTLLECKKQKSLAFLPDSRYTLLDFKHKREGEKSCEGLISLRLWEVAFQ
jgi:hypothetical protein